MIILRPAAAAVLAFASTVSAQEGPAKAGGAVDAAARSASQVPAVAIGVVDVARVFDQNPRLAKMKQDLNALGKSFDERLQLKMRELDELNAAIKTMADGDEREEKKFEYQLRLREAEGLEKVYGDRLNTERMRCELAIFEDIDAATRKVARDRGVSVVLKSSDPEPLTVEVGKLGGTALKNRHLMHRNRDVLYAADAVDLTADVIKVLMVPIDKPGADRSGGDKPKDAGKAEADPKSGDPKTGDPKAPAPRTGG
jgi:Skp family chaperone for outer membrane proteins